MQTSILFLIILAVLISLSIAFYQYLYKINSKNKVDYFLFSLRGLSLFLLLLLLINPQIKTTKTSNIKPVLAILMDNSFSISYFDENKNMVDYYSKLKENGALQNKFALKYYSFGATITTTDSLLFNKQQTNIAKAIEVVNDLNKDNLGAILLFTDGNQTIGSDYEFLNSKKPIYPVVIGDTTPFKDVRITQLNVNKYSYLKNQFPVETFLFYEGNEKETTQFTISTKGKVLFRENVSFSPTEKSKIITTNLTSTEEGINYYMATVQKLKDEKNTNNNVKPFSVEVINEQTKILVLTSFLHPDIGALKKAIESNKQRKVDISLIDNFKNQLNDYQLVIIYQPNYKFTAILNKIKQEKTNFLLITGTETDYTSINNSQLGFTKNTINQTENFGAYFNETFLTYSQKNIGFEGFPPLKDKFGEVVFQKEHQTLLFQNINGISTQQPLLASLTENNQKKAVLFGSGIWKWRAASFLNQNSFEDFDEFIGGLMQYLTSNKKRERLHVSYHNLYASNEAITIAAFYLDENYQFDNRASLMFSYTNKGTNENKKLPFSARNNSFSLTLNDLQSGEYSFEVSVQNQPIKKYGSFKITDYKVEELFTNANRNKLEKLAKNTQGTLIYPNGLNTFLDDLKQDKNFYTTQETKVLSSNLIDWKWILGVGIALFSVEWFTRKYFGKI